MRKLLGILVLAAAVVAAVSLLPGGPPAEMHGRESATARVEVKEPRAEGSVAGEARAEARARRIREQAAARAEMGRKIAEATAVRERRIAAEAEQAAERRAAPEAEAEAEGAAGPGMIDRTGTRGYLMRVMKEDLLPLADECYELARAGDPTLAGMLQFDVEIVGDADIGGVIEAAEPGANNTIADAGLIECVRESLLATTLPPPPTGGRDAVALSMPFGPDA
jgi:hypothetical protein